VIDEKKQSSIVCAKAKVTPLRLKSKMKCTEMPRLELYSALMATRLVDSFTKMFPEIHPRIFLWTDSEVVLKWLNNPNISLKKYAVSPIGEILEKTQVNNWHYVSTKLNVADIATKIRKYDFGDPNSTWFTGPEFIRKPEADWPIMKPTKQVNVITMDDNHQKFTRQIPYDSPVKLPPNDCAMFDDKRIDDIQPKYQARWESMVNIIALAFKIYYDGLIPLVKAKMLHNMPAREKLKKENDSFHRLVPADLLKAELFLVRRVQKQIIPDEYKSLAEGKSFKHEGLAQLKAYIDTQGIIRIDSRVKLDTSIYPNQHQPYLPRGHNITRSYLLFVHNKFRHICIESQIAYIRAQYWIPQLRQALRSIQSHCNICNHMRAKPIEPQMAILPNSRVDPTQHPFQVTGVDCMGPITVKIYTKTKKVWIMIFTCTLTRFCQFFILESLESIKVLEAIVSFHASNGPIQTFISDNGTNFIGAARFLNEQRSRTGHFLMNQNKVLGTLLAVKYKIEWKFIPPGSPWFGGFYERLIKEIKRALADTLEGETVTKTQLNIALQDACHRINCRPLTHNSICSQDDPVLTPHHLAKNRPGWPYLPGIAEPDDKDDRLIYSRGRLLADKIMKRFVDQYLPVLTATSKWTKDKGSLKIGDIVLLIEPTKTRHEWSRGKIVGFSKARTGQGRVANVFIKHDKVVKRPVRKLARLFITNIDEAK
jgi:hypothetical protein